MSGCECVPWVFPAGLCGITDTWDREPTTSPDWGIADAHIEWDEDAGGGGEVNIEAFAGRLFVPELTDSPADSASVEASLLDERPAIRSDFTVTFAEWTSVGPPIDGGVFFRFLDHGFGFHIENSVTTVPVTSVHKLRLVASYPTIAQEEIAFDPTPGSQVTVRHEVDEGVEQRVYVNGALLLSQDISAHTWLPTGRIGFGLNSSGDGAVPIPAFEVHVNDLDCMGTDGPIAWCVPVLNQPVLDEAVGVGDGVTTAYSTRFPYVVSSLQVYVGTILQEADPTNPATGQFTLIDPAPLGAAIRASYRMGAA